MIRLEDRQTLVTDIDTAREAGARLALACDMSTVTVRDGVWWFFGHAA